MRQKVIITILFFSFTLSFSLVKSNNDTIYIWSNGFCKRTSGVEYYIFGDSIRLNFGYTKANAKECIRKKESPYASLDTVIYNPNFVHRINDILRIYFIEKTQKAAITQKERGSIEYDHGFIFIKTKDIREYICYEDEEYLYVLNEDTEIFIGELCDLAIRIIPDP